MPATVSSTVRSFVARSVLGSTRSSAVAQPLVAATSTPPPAICAAESVVPGLPCRILRANVSCGRLRSCTACPTCDDSLLTVTSASVAAGGADDETAVLVHPVTVATRADSIAARVPRQAHTIGNPLRRADTFVLYNSATVHQVARTQCQARHLPQPGLGDPHPYSPILKLSPT